MKEAAYKGMVRPILDYGSSVWDPHPDKLQKELEKVQNRAARFVTRNFFYNFIFNSNKYMIQSHKHIYKAFVF